MPSVDSPMFKFNYNPANIEIIERNMIRLGAAIGGEITGEGTEAMAQEVAQEAKALVRVRTGKTRRSIRVVKETTGVGNEMRIRHLVVAGTPDHRAALFLEFGTIKMPSYPFLRPAIDRSRRKASRAFEVETKRYFERFARSLPKR